MDDGRVAMCVITVLEGPDGARSAVVAHRNDLSLGQHGEHRGRYLPVADVLDEVRAFLDATMTRST
jgi:hypothetical protein